MKNNISVLLLIVIALFTACSPSNTSNDTKSSSILSSNWKVLKQEQGVILASAVRDNAIKDTDYVIIVDLKSGAAIRPLLKTLNDTLASPTFFSYSVTDATAGHQSFWTLFHNDTTFAMTNLTCFVFHHDTTPTTQLCYPVYYQGKMVTSGCVSDCCTEDKRLAQKVVIISETAISILNYNGSDSIKKIISEKATVAALVGNAPIVNRSGEGNNSVGRTYLAKKGSNLIIYCTRHSTEKQIDSLIRTEFKVDSNDIVMFDGGASTQMICQGIPYIKSKSSRWVPCALEVFYRQKARGK